MIEPVHPVIEPVETARRRPLELVYTEEFTRIDEAFRREKQVQGWGRAKRLALIDGFPGDLPILSRNYSDSASPANREAEPDRSP